MKNNKIIRWFLKHSLTIASCVLITGLGIVFLVWSSPGTTTIGEDISTGDITASGDVTVSGDLEAKTGRTATLVVAATNSTTTSKAQADYVCTGTNDHVQIQAALDALPATGGEVRLLDGTYNIEVSLVLDSYQTLRGCGRSTILTTTTAGLDIITATGGSGTEEVGILIADLYIDGTAGGSTVSLAINFTYVDYSRVIGIWIENCTTWGGIGLLNCDFNEMIGNTLKNSGEGFYLSTSCFNIIAGNSVSGGVYEGIYLESSSNYNIISGNTFQGNGQVGIGLDSSSNNTISGNICQWNDYIGIDLSRSSNNNNISGNICQGNSQVADNTYANIGLHSSDYNLIANNLCRAPTVGTTLTVSEPIGETEIAVTDTAGFEVGMGVVIDLGGGNVEYHRISAIAAGVITIDAGLTHDQAAGETIDVPEARYGINIASDFSDRNCLIGNDLYDSGKTGDLNDVPTTNPTLKHDNRDLAGTGWLAEQ